MVQEGDVAPELDLPGSDGASLNLAALRGSPVVVYFYPKDATAGCTTEAKEFSSLAAAFKAARTRVIGVSPDSIASHRKFIDKHDLAVTLAADTDKQAAEAYGVWVEKSMYGRKYMGVERSTFLIGSDGRIARIWRKVKVAGHAEDVLSAARAIAK